MVSFSTTESSFQETVMGFRELIPGDRPNRVDFSSLDDKNEQNFRNEERFLEEGLG